MTLSPRVFHQMRKIAAQRVAQRACRSWGFAKRAQENANNTSAPQDGAPAASAAPAPAEAPAPAPSPVADWAASAAKTIADASVGAFNWARDAATSTGTYVGDFATRRPTLAGAAVGAIGASAVLAALLLARQDRTDKAPRRSASRLSRR